MMATEPTQTPARPRRSAAKHPNRRASPRSRGCTRINCLVAAITDHDPALGSRVQGFALLLLQAHRQKFASEGRPCPYGKEAAARALAPVYLYNCFNAFKLGKTGPPRPDQTCLVYTIRRLDGVHVVDRRGYQWPCRTLHRRPRLWSTTSGGTSSLGAPSAAGASPRRPHPLRYCSL